MISAGMYISAGAEGRREFADRRSASGLLGDLDENANASEHAYLRRPSGVLSARLAGDARVSGVARGERLRPPLAVAQGVGWVRPRCPGLRSPVTPPDPSPHGD